MNMDKFKLAQNREHVKCDRHPADKKRARRKARRELKRQGRKEEKEDADCG